MKKLIVLAIASIISSHTNAIESGTNNLAWSLAQTIYVTALGLVSTRNTGRISSSKESKAEALRIQSEAQNFYQTGYASIFLESKIELARELNSNLSDSESVDLLVEASKIILGQ